MATCFFFARISKLVFMSQKDIKQFFDNLAPKWDSLEIIKDEHIIDLFKEIGINKGDKILDVGCGTGRVTYLLHAFSQTDVIGIDISSKMIELAKEKYMNESYATFISDDFMTYHFENKFDLIVIYNAFPHFLDVDKLSLAMKNNLNEHGKFAIVHSLGRSTLQDVHSTVNTSLTRHLNDPLTESWAFEKEFKIVITKEDDNSFLIIGQKR